MNPSTLLSSNLHVAIIMDGNGRWAQARGRSRTEGHRAGAEAVRRTVEAAPELGIGTLTLHAFSSDNWRRPSREVAALMDLFRRYLLAESGRCAEHEIRVSVIGRRDRLQPAVRRAIEAAEAATAQGTALHLRIAIDYSARDSVLRAAWLVAGCPRVSPRAFSQALAQAVHADETTPDVDLMIRTGGERRLSDLLGWDSAYAELIFTETMWPDFQAADLRAAVEEFRRRERRFGGLPLPVEDQASRPVVRRPGARRISTQGIVGSPPAARDVVSRPESIPPGQNGRTMGGHESQRRTQGETSIP